MKKVTKISTKIKLLGASLIIFMLGAISMTIYLNQQNAKDALVVNIVGKQRMLTQKISKNIFYIHYSSNKDFYELNGAVNEFIEGLNTLKHGNEDKGISSAPTLVISNQLKAVHDLWDPFYENIQNFKLYTNSSLNRKVELDYIVNYIYKNNTPLLNNVDKLVTMYTNHSEHKTEYIKSFQYGAAAIFIILFMYSLMQLRVIEAHVDDFMNYSKMILNNDAEDISKLEPIKLQDENESELQEVGDTINCFVAKINSAMDHSNEALLQSQQASEKLEELTDEFDIILDDLQDKSLVQEQLSNSEDIVIQSSEELINSTKRLQNLKLELEKLTLSCQTATP